MKCSDSPSRFSRKKVELSNPMADVPMAEVVEAAVEVTADIKDDRMLRLL